MQPDNISLNKAAIIERCLRRMHEEYTASPELDNYTHLDALMLNIERACQAAIDLAMHIVADGHLGIPQSSADAFRLLAKANRMNAELANRLSKMTGFRNIAIHQYQDLDLDIVHHIMKRGWHDLVTFCTVCGHNITPPTTSFTENQKTMSALSQSISQTLCSGVRISGKGDEKMKCHRCGREQVNKQISDLPFKLDMHQVLIVKNVPCQICDACGETMLNDAGLASIDQIIDRVKSTPSELDVVPYAA